MFYYWCYGTLGLMNKTICSWKILWISYLLQAKCFIRSIPWKMFYSWFLEKCDTYANNPPPCSHACYHNAANIVSNPIPKNRCKNHFCSASGNWEMAEWDRPFICSIGSVQWYLVRPPSPIMSPIFVTKTVHLIANPLESKSGEVDSESLDKKYFQDLLYWNTSNG